MNFELEEESAHSVVQSEGVLPEAAQCIAHASVGLDRQVGILLGTRDGPRQTCVAPRHVDASRDFNLILFCFI